MQGADGEPQVRVIAASDRQHSRGEVDARDGATTVGDVPAHATRAATGVEHEPRADLADEGVDHRQVKRRLR